MVTRGPKACSRGSSRWSTAVTESSLEDSLASLLHAIGLYCASGSAYQPQTVSP
jgi:hypothetical protein